MTDSPNLVTAYTTAIHQLLKEHRADERPNWAATLSSLKIVGFDPKTRMFEVIGRDEVEGRNVEIKVTFGQESDAQLVDVRCQCAVFHKNANCDHSVAALQLVLTKLSNAADSLARALMSPPKQARATPAKKSPPAAAKPPVAAAQPTDETAPFKLVADQTPQHRLVFHIVEKRNSSGSTLFVQPIVEELSKNRKGWKQGRPLRWNELHQSPYLTDSPLDQAIKAISASMAPWDRGIPSIIEVLTTLAGSQRVFLDNAQVEIVKGPLDIECSVSDRKFHVGFKCKGKDLNRCMGIVKEEDSFWAATISPTDVAVVNTCSAQGLEFLHQQMMHRDVPLEKADAVIEQLVAFGTQFKVTLPDGLFGEPVVGDPRIRMELVPTLPQGLIIRFRINPAADLIGIPGGLRGTSFLDSNDRFVRVIRDPNAEFAKATSLINELQVRQFSSLTDWDWRIATNNAALAFIARLFDRQLRKLSSVSNEKNETGNTTPSASLQTGQSLTKLCGEIPATDDLVVCWPQGGEFRMTREITPSALRLEVDDQRDWFGLNGTIEIDGFSIPLQKLISALKSGHDYLLLGDGLWTRITDEFRQRLNVISDLVHTTSKGMEVDITAVPMLQEIVDVRENLSLCQTWTNLLDRVNSKDIQDANPSASFTADLRSYQLDGYRWMKRLSTWGVGGCLADDMGLGKTVQALAVLLDRQEEGPILVVAPMSVGFNWIRETEKFAPTLHVVSYRDANRAEALKDLKAGDIVIVSYGLLQRDSEKFAAVEWGTLVLDEAQNIKNASTKTARAIRDLNAKWRLALTGTPVENALSELWALFRAISPGVFGSWERFRERFVGPIEKKNDPERRFALARMVRPFILRRTKDDVLTELPARTDVLRTIELSPEERKHYEDVRLAICAQLAQLDFGTPGNDNRFTVLAAITKLRQLACHPKLIDANWNQSSAKLDAFIEIVDELRAEKHRALVFSQFTKHLDIVRTALDAANISYQYLDGSSTATARQKAVDAFQAGEGDLFLISLKAGGSGLNLTGADYVIHLDPWWNPAVEDQATDRAHRIGQTRPVTVYRLVSAATIEEKILSLHERKRELVESILSGTDEAAKLSTEELVDLIKGESAATASRSPAAGAGTGAGDTTSDATGAAASAVTKDSSGDQDSVLEAAPTKKRARQKKV